METRILFLDVETTSLDPNEGQLLELAAILVEANLDPVARLGPFLFDVPPCTEMLSTLDMHRASGLLAEKGTRTTVAEVERVLLLVLAGEMAIPHRSLEIAGYSVHFDRRWLAVHMPTLDGWLSHRMIDVSTIRQLLRRWAPEHVPEGDKAHRAMKDCEAALAELRTYKPAISSHAMPF